MTKKLLIFLVMFIVALPPLILTWRYHYDPPVKEFQLQYREHLTDEEIKAGARPLGVNYCFEVPLTLKLDNDLQDFMLAFTKIDLKQVFLSDASDINKLNYEVIEGCKDYAAKLEKDQVIKAYQAFKDGEL